VTIDDLGRAAATAARRKASQEVEPAMMLRQLRRTHRTRNVLAVAGVLVAVAAAAVVVVHAVAPTPRLQPGQPPSPSASASCPEGLTCLGAGRYRLHLPVPVTLTEPSTFEGLTQLGPESFEDYRNDVAKASGVTIMENALPASNDPEWPSDPSGGTTAQSMATWFVHRPFLQRAAMQPVTVGGKSGWLLTAGVRPGVPLKAAKSGEPCGPLFRAGAGTTAGITATLQGEYVVLDTPGAGVTVIWFWTYDSDKGVLLDSTAYLDHLTFG
jgi:hypothetical protein